MIDKKISFNYGSKIAKGTVLDKLLVACIVDANENEARFNSDHKPLNQVVSTHRFLVSIHISDEESKIDLIAPEDIIAVIL